MTVIRSTSFALDDATLSGGAAIVAAGSGLPRRITGALDYEALVLALNPTGYWPMNEASGAFVNRVSGGTNLTADKAQRAVSGCGVGGSATAAVQHTDANGVIATAGAELSAVRLVAGTPWSLFGWFKMEATTTTLPPNSRSFAVAQSQATSFSNGGGFTFGWFANVGPMIIMGSGSSNTQMYFLWNDAIRMAGGLWVPVAVVYSGGTLNLSSQWACRIANRLASTRAIGSVTSIAAAGNFSVGGCSDELRRSHMQHLAVWNNYALTTSDIAALSSAVPCGRAVWTLPSAAASRTLKGFQLPGRLARNDATRLGVRAKYDVGAGEVEFDPGDDLSVTIPAGQEVSLIANLTHYDLEDLPYIGDSLGGGPVALYEEADPAAPPQYVAALDPVLSRPSVFVPADITAQVLHPVVNQVPVVVGE